MLETKQEIIGDRYQIKSQLSHKAGRKTLLALDLATNQQVTIEISQFDNLFEWDDLKLFEREAKTLKNINHSATPKYLDYFEIDNEEIRGFALVQTYTNIYRCAKFRNCYSTGTKIYRSRINRTSPKAAGNS